MATVHLSFGLFATNKYPILCHVPDVEDKVTLVAKHGTYIDASTNVFDTYEVLADSEQLRAFLDFDIKRFADKSKISRFDGVVIAEHIKTALETMAPVLEERYGRIAVGSSCGNKARGEYCVSFRIWLPCVVGSRSSIMELARSLFQEFLPTFQTSTGPYLDRIDWSTFCDESVYKNMGKLRLPGCTKQGENHRPLQLDPELSSIGVRYADCLVTYWNSEEVTFLDESESNESGTNTNTSAHVSRTPDVLDLTSHVPDEVFTLVTNLASIPVVEWDRNAARFQLIAAL